MGINIFKNFINFKEKSLTINNYIEIYEIVYKLILNHLYLDKNFKNEYDFKIIYLEMINFIIKHEEFKNDIFLIDMVEEFISYKIDINSIKIRTNSIFLKNCKNYIKMLSILEDLLDNNKSVYDDKKYKLPNLINYNYLTIKKNIAI